MTNYQTLQINTDGGSRGNPGPSAIGVAATSDNTEIFTISKYIGVTTNNVSEYTAVIEALNYLAQNKISAKNIKFILDSELIVKQINGIYKIKQPHLLELNTKIKTSINNLLLSKQIEYITFEHVLRENNKEADRLVNIALDSNI